MAWELIAEEDWAQLEVAAELTVGAAAAAVLWAGEDAQRVLRRVAAASPALMVGARECKRMMTKFVCTRPSADLISPTLTPAEEIDLSQAEGFGLAGLPWSLAPVWGATVRAAYGAARQRREWVRELGRWSDYSTESTKALALWTIALWGEEPLSLGEIELAARSVTDQLVWYPCPEGDDR